VSQENVELMRRALDHFRTTGEFLPGVLAADFVWDMSTFRNWPEQQAYEGVEGARTFIREWTAAFDDWRFEVEEIHDAGADKVVAVLRQRGRSKSTGLPVDMLLAQVYTLDGGRQTRMQMYADPAEALKAVGLEE
jgi:ketosteroid isomerase-like protein